MNQRVQRHNSSGQSTPRSATTEPEASVRDGAPTERITMHVLVVEDDARLAEALARILEDNGYTTDVVHDGEAGVRYGGPAPTTSSSWTSCYRRPTVSPWLSACAERMWARPHSAAHRPRCHKRQNLRLRLRRRRLHDQALLPAERPLLGAPHAAPGRCRLETLTVGDLTLNLESMDLTCGDESIRPSQR